MNRSFQRPRVLVFNFFGGVIDRGIPIYAQDIGESLRRAGFEPLELRCPRWLRSLPRPFRNAAFVSFEQVVAPIVRLVRRCSVTVYPYNSAGIIDAALGRSVIVVHDILSNRRNNGAMAARYIRASQAIHTALARPVCAASEHTLSHLRRLDAFRACPLQLWPNAFYAFEAALSCHSEKPKCARRRTRVLLCSGMGSNKDYAGAIKLFRQSQALANAELRVVGFGNDAYLAERRVARLPAELRKRITVLPRLTLNEIVAEYCDSDLVWVHSRHEGFGRSVVEARLCGRPVVASRIGAFRQFASFGIELYRDAEFDAAVVAALESDGSAPRPDVRAYHSSLEAAVTRAIEPLLNRQAARSAGDRGQEPSTEAAD